MGIHDLAKNPGSALVNFLYEEEDKRFQFNSLSQLKSLYGHLKERGISPNFLGGYRITIKDALRLPHDTVLPFFIDQTTRQETALAIDCSLTGKIYSFAGTADIIGHASPSEITFRKVTEERPSPEYADLWEKLLGEMPEKVFAESVVHKTTFNDTRQHYEGVCGKRFKLKRRKVELWAKIGLWDTSERLYIQQPFGFLED
ncbi:hypothetical protein HOC32_04595 [Candidatus Woesearchaeota archaeon]|jgi:hypothetical protein|nr:hypothetical protein [Candidatus Woesearchaeota archaeon]